MGEVYRARDMRLQRDVAIKVLLAGVADNPDRLARFQREAKTLAALNHPNIAHIHGIEEGPSGPFLVLEFVGGPTLADRLAGGPLPSTIDPIPRRTCSVSILASGSRSCEAAAHTTCRLGTWCSCRVVLSWRLHSTLRRSSSEDPRFR
jgi:serine/threonine protein kinase